MQEQPENNNCDVNSERTLVMAGKPSNLELLSISNPEISFIHRKESSISLCAVQEENRTSLLETATAATAVKHPTIKSPLLIRQEAINYLGDFFFFLFCFHLLIFIY